MSLEQLKNDLIHWHTDEYPNIDNTPGRLSAAAITAMTEQLLLPIEQEFGQINIRYGFIGNSLSKSLKAKDINPKQDQHIGSELNAQGQLVCERQGMACDFTITGHETNMYDIAQWIAARLPFDRMYLYGPDKAIHLSYGPDDSRLIQCMNIDDAGQRIAGKEVHADNFDQLIS